MSALTPKKRNEVDEQNEQKEKWKEEQERDEFCTVITQALERSGGTGAKEEEFTLKNILKKNHFTMINGLLVRIDCTGARQLYVPKSLRTEVLHLTHDSLMNCHLGITKTYRRLKQNFW